MFSHQTTGPGEVMEMITLSSSDALSSDNGPGEVMEMITVSSSDTLSSDNGPGEVMEMITFSSSDALSSDKGARGSDGNNFSKKMIGFRKKCWQLFQLLFARY